MSCSCNIHGWQHLLNPCPSCAHQFVSTGSLVEGCSIKEGFCSMHGPQASKVDPRDEVIKVLVEALNKYTNPKDYEDRGMGPFVYPSDAQEALTRAYELMPELKGDK